MNLREEFWNWWKNPALQGEDNDYGDYDYLAEEISEDTNKVEWFYSKCEDCGKYHHFNRYLTHYFYTLDGYDYDTYVICLKCDIKSRIHSKKMLIKQLVERERQKFFGYTKVGKALCHYAVKLNKKNDNKFTRKFVWLTLPF